MTDIKEKIKAADKVRQWAGAGKKAFELAKASEKAKLDGNPLPATPENISTTISGAVKLFLDGHIMNKHIRESLSKILDMNNIRRDLVEQTMVRAINIIVASGDIERLANLGKLAGEETITIPQNATKIVQERVTIEIDPKDVIEC